MTTLEYGDWKSIEEIGFADLSSHPIWVWCSLLPGEEDGPMGGDECSMRPLLSMGNVTAAHPSAIILLRVKDTDYYASGCYDLRARQGCSPLPSYYRRLTLRDAWSEEARAF